MQNLTQSESIDSLVKTIKRGILKCNLCKWGGSMALGFGCSRLYRCIIENPNPIAIICGIIFIGTCVAIVASSFIMKNKIVKTVETTLNDIVLLQVNVQHELENNDDEIEKSILKQKEQFLKKAFDKLCKTI